MPDRTLDKTEEVLPTSPSPTCSRTRVVVADDTPFFLENLCAFLEADGRFEIVGRATDGLEAVDLTQKHRPELVFLDVQMPRMNGLDAAWIIKTQPDRPWVVIVTLCDTPECRNFAKAVGADGFVPKEKLQATLPALMDLLLKGRGV